MTIKLNIQLKCCACNWVSDTTSLEEARKAAADHQSDHENSTGEFVYFIAKPEGIQ